MFRVVLTWEKPLDTLAAPAYTVQSTPVVYFATLVIIISPFLCLNSLAIISTCGRKRP